ncbi:hypothetical protein DAI22_10g001000 [Oryza sativa Japonica Group]|nr:hypothetical protein DAI22_10g001000 [Oryza sativa Japonica Group]
MVSKYDIQKIYLCMKPKTLYIGHTPALRYLHVENNHRLGILIPTQAAPQTRQSCIAQRIFVAIVGFTCKPREQNDIHSLNNISVNEDSPSIF